MASLEDLDILVVFSSLMGPPSRSVRQSYCIGAARPNGSYLVTTQSQFYSELVISVTTFESTICVLRIAAGGPISIRGYLYRGNFRSCFDKNYIGYVDNPFLPATVITLLVTDAEKTIAPVSVYLALRKSLC